MGSISISIQDHLRLSSKMSENDSTTADKFGVSPLEMDIDPSKEVTEKKHIEDVEDMEYYNSAEFKARERKVVRKMDWYIAPLMGSFNFIVS